MKTTKMPLTRPAFTAILASLLSIIIVPLDQAADTTYKNPRYGFCFSYPANWVKIESQTRDGVSLVRQDSPKSTKRERIDVGVSMNQPANLDSPEKLHADKPRSLEEVFQSGLKALREEDGAKRVTVLSRTDVKVDGVPALVAEVEYVPEADHAKRYLRELLFIRNLHVYSIELDGIAPIARQSVPAFQRVVDSFRVDCLPHE